MTLTSAPQAPATSTPHITWWVSMSEIARTSVRAIAPLSQYAIRCISPL